MITIKCAICGEEAKIQPHTTNSDILVVQIVGIKPFTMSARESIESMLTSAGYYRMWHGGVNRICCGDCRSRITRSASNEE